MADTSPPRSNDIAVASLLSLSRSMEPSAPIPVVKQEPQSAGGGLASSTRSHRRLSSSVTARSTRGVSAAGNHRLSPSSVGSAQVASLSLSSSPGGPLSTSTGSLTLAERKVRPSAPIPIGNVKPGKKRGQDYKCETCSKIYRHPSCLIKHRWEHTSQWKEASKFVLSKHQQVQLLEAAAILSHLSADAATGTSLPEDRSLWPAFLSNGSLPPPDGTALPSPTATKSSMSVPHQASGVIGTGRRAGSTGPRLHDYSIPISASDGGGITEVRPGLLGVPTGSNNMSSPVPVPQMGHSYREPGSWGGASSSYQSGGGWSLPRSSVRSESSSADDDDDSVVDIEIDEPELPAARYRTRSSARVWKREDDDSMGDIREDEDYESETEDVRKRPVSAQEEWNDEMEMDMD